MEERLLELGKQFYQIAKETGNTDYLSISICNGSIVIFNDPNKEEIIDIFEKMEEGNEQKKSN